MKHPEGWHVFAMKDLLKKLMRHKADFVIAGIKAVVYLGLFVLFFSMMSINNWPLRNVSRTTAITLVTYVAMSCVMHSVYGGCDIGRKKSKPVISSMILATLGVDLITYLELQIMNVNADNNQTLVLFGADFPYLILCIVLQCMLIIAGVRIGNATFFRYHPPRSCLLITRTIEERNVLIRKISRYRLQWRVERSVLFDDPDLQRHISRSEVVFLGTLPPAVQMNILHTCYDMKRDVISKAQLEDIMLSTSRQIIVDDAPFLAMEFHKITLGQRIAKRLIDIVFSSLVLLVFSPLFLIITVCILLEDGKPVIFRQKRLTIDGREFSICKFRTMTAKASQKKHQRSASANDARITRTGKWLRRFRIDELPQFWNILRGDMTIVGPRPEMLDNIRQYKMELPAFAYREKMKAGLTGYAQIEGRYNTTPEDKVMLDLMYIESFSVWQDIKLIFRTLTVFFKSDSTQGFEPAPVTSDNNHHDSGLAAGS